MGDTSGLGVVPVGEREKALVDEECGGVLGWWCAEAPGLGMAVGEAILIVYAFTLCSVVQW